jgi:hypothetical protein
LAIADTAVTNALHRIGILEPLTKKVSVHANSFYNGSEPNCCPEGGERHLIYRWDGHQFVLDDMIDVPPAKSGT